MRKKKCIVVLLLRKNLRQMRQLMGGRTNMTTSVVAFKNAYRRRKDKISKVHDFYGDGYCMVVDFDFLIYRQKT